MEIKKVGVVGCGLMGSGIAHVSAASGYKTLVREISQELLDKGLGSIEKYLAKAIARGKGTVFEKRMVADNLSGTTKLEDLKDSDIIIEAITEDIKIKNEVFATLDKLCPEHTIFASNTSSLKISEMTKATSRPDKFVGLHFFNPVPVMKLVEVVRMAITADETFDTAMQFVKSLDKVAVPCKDTTGFVVNRLLVPYLLDAIRALEASVASPRDIDNAMMLGCGYPMGPLALLDFVGLDTTLYIANIMFDEFKQPQYAPPELLKKMVAEGKLGKKSGEGFYKY
ncbi:MAG: 3-hydroxyacyl-CoA dehydrogenase family protein [bacterium]